MASTISIVLLAGFLLPIAGFAFYGLMRIPPNVAEDSGENYLDDYLLCGKHAIRSDFTQSTTAYMLQISVTYYFVYWGYHYGFANISFMATWAIGIFVFSICAHRIYDLTHQHETVPKFLSNGSRSVRWAVASVITFFLIGFMYLELFFASEFLDLLSSGPAGTPKRPFFWWVFFVAFLSATLAYSAFGGLRKVYITDKIQLGIAYLGFSIVFSYILPIAFNVNAPTAAIVGLFACAVYVFLLVESVRPLEIGFKFFSISISTAILASVYIYGFVMHAHDVLGEPLLVSGLLSQAREDYGWVPLLGFTVLNILWQLCDPTNYQRVASLEKEHLSRENRIRLIREEMHRVAFVSPITWGLGIILGMSIKAAGINATGDVSEFVSFLHILKENSEAGQFLAVFAALALGAALAAVLMSTLDTCFLAAMQTAIRDLLPSPRTSGAARMLILSCTLVTFLSVIILAVAHRVLGVDTVFTMVAAVNAQLLVIAPAIIAYLAQISVGQKAVMTSLFTGTILTWWTTFAPPYDAHANVLLVLPIFSSLAGASLPIMSSMVINLILVKMGRQ